MEKIKILHIIHGLNYGGAENFIFNVLKLIGSKEYQFDFAIQNSLIRNINLKNLIEELGGTIYIIPDFRKNPIGEFFVLRKILANGYNYIHIHMNALINPIPVIVSSFYQKKIIIHSHNTSSAGGKLGKIIHKFNTAVFLRNKFINVACGTDAGKWMFGEKKFQVLNNAVNLDMYKFKPSLRRKIRNQYKLSDEFVIGQVGRLIEVKNQTFSLHLLRAYIDHYPSENVKLMLLGEGKMYNKLKVLAHDLNIDNNVIFTGAINNPYDYYSSFDCLILPSLYEGLAFVAVEAQSSGLKIIASNNNTTEINITGEVTFISLDNQNLWISALHNCSKSYNRAEISGRLRGTKYDDDMLKEVMLKIYHH